MTKLVLFPVRFLFTAETGQVGTNALAVKHFLADPQAPSKTLVEAAMGWRDVAPGNPDGTARLLGHGLIRLYLYFIADYEKRLMQIGRPDLASRYQKWRDRLTM